MERNIIIIDQDRCNGCGLCIPNCPEVAIQVIESKARLVSDLMCDGLGACLGHCPEGAIRIEKREAGEYDEARVMENIVKQGAETRTENAFPHAAPLSRLTHWPIQLHLLSPNAPHFRKSDFVLAADCTAFSLGDFHDRFLRGKTLGIACPKLDDGQEIYGEKIRALIDEAQIDTLTVVIMEVPCCRGLLQIVRNAAANSKRKVPVKCVTVGIKGEILHEEWL